MPKLSDDRRTTTIAAILASLEKGSTLVAACKAGGIAPYTLRIWRKGDENLEKDVQARRASQIDIVEDALFSQALKGNVRAQMFFLANRAPDQWQALSRIVHDVRGQVQHTVADWVREFGNGRVDAGRLGAGGN